MGEWGGSRHRSATVNMLYRLAVRLNETDRQAVLTTIQLLEADGVPPTHESIIWELAATQRGHVRPRDIIDAILARHLSRSTRAQLWSRVYHQLDALGFQRVERGVFQAPALAEAPPDV